MEIPAEFRLGGGFQILFRVLTEGIPKIAQQLVVGVHGDKRDLLQLTGVQTGYVAVAPHYRLFFEVRVALVVGRYFSVMFGRKSSKTGWLYQIAGSPGHW
ncbi:hypothetical protein KKI24_03450 [bacterium]|nr:hypothetical protein [bacterium]